MSLCRLVNQAPAVTFNQRIVRGRRGGRGASDCPPLGRPGMLLFRHTAPGEARGRPTDPPAHLPGSVTGLRSARSAQRYDTELRPLAVPGERSPGSPEGVLCWSSAVHISPEHSTCGDVGRHTSAGDGCGAIETAVWISGLQCRSALPPVAQIGGLPATVGAPRWRRRCPISAATINGRS